VVIASYFKDSMEEFGKTDASQRQNERQPLGNVPCSQKPGTKEKEERKGERKEGKEGRKEERRKEGRKKEELTCIFQLKFLNRT
jgi:hypothetical protein